MKTKIQKLREKWADGYKYQLYRASSGSDVCKLLDALEKADEALKFYEDKMVGKLAKSGMGVSHWYAEYELPATKARKEISEIMEGVEV